MNRRRFFSLIPAAPLVVAADSEPKLTPIAEIDSTISMLRPGASISEFAEGARRLANVVKQLASGRSGRE